MKKFTDTMKEVGSNVHLTTEEKDLMRSRLREYMGHVPLRTAAQPTPVVSVVAALHYRFGAVLVVLSLVFVSGVGVTYASNDALPGDALYAVKEAREEITQALILDEEKRIEYAIDRTHQRLQEAEKLAMEGRLDKETEELVTEKFTTLSEEVENQINTLEEEQPARAEALRIALTVGVEARSEVLAQRLETVEEDENEARGRIASVAQRRAVDTRPTARSSATASTMVMAFESKIAASDTPVAATSSAAADMMIMAAPAPVERTVTAEHITSLVRAVNKQRDKLKKLGEETKDERTQEKIDAILQEVQVAQKEITDAIRNLEHARAEVLVQETLRNLHKIIAAIEVNAHVQTPILPKAPVPAPPPIATSTPQTLEEGEEASQPPSTPPQKLPTPSTE